jgi:glutathione-regulated potassium-efflux system ancillary protein KefF
VTTTGGDDEAYRPEGMHGRPFEEYLPVVEQTAVFCGMRWEEPLIVKGAHRVTDAELDELARLYRRRLSALIAEGGRP